MHISHLLLQKGLVVMMFSRRVSILWHPTQVLSGRLISCDIATLWLELDKLVFLPPKLLSEDIPNIQVKSKCLTDIIQGDFLPILNKENLSEVLVQYLNRARLILIDLTLDGQCQVC